MIELYNDDCFEVMSSLINKNIKVDSIIVDPPYNIKYTEWDNDFDIEKSIFYCDKIIKENGNIIFFQGWSNVCETKKFLINILKFKIGLFGIE